MVLANPAGSAGTGAQALASRSRALQGRAGLQGARGLSGHLLRARLISGTQAINSVGPDPWLDGLIISTGVGAFGRAGELDRQVEAEVMRVNVLGRL